jgi:DNA-directed RNA polymerase specialized sigma24 family protein
VSASPESRSPVFATTRWTLVLAAGRADDPGAAEALETLCRRYWFPLYAFVRRQGFDADQAQDLTQGFFALLLERNDLAGLVRGEGRFRSFLLKALTHYLINERARAHTLKRGGGRTIISLDDDSAEDRYLHEPAHHETPEKAFERQWALALLETALREVEAEEAARGKQSHFDALKPFLSREPEPGEYAALAAGLSLEQRTLAVQVHRLRARYREAVRAAVADTVDGPVEVEAEMRHLLVALT